MHYPDSRAYSPVLVVPTVAVVGPPVNRPVLQDAGRDGRRGALPVVAQCRVRIVL